MLEEHYPHAIHCLMLPFSLVRLSDSSRLTYQILYPFILSQPDY